MNTLYQFCKSTGRRISRVLNRLVASLTRKGKLSLSITLSIPLVAKMEVSYTAELGSRMADDA